MKRKFKIDSNVWIYDDGKWTVNIPFNCIENEDVVLTYVDSEEYINEHKDMYANIKGGNTYNGKCELVTTSEPSCDITVAIEKLHEVGGTVFYSEDGNPQYIPPFTANCIPMLNDCGVAENETL